MNCIYKITNQINGKSYIGLTTQSIERRWSEHVSRFNLGIRDHKLYLAMKKHGVENFWIECLCETEGRQSLKQLEVDYIEKFNTFNRGYNMTRGGDMITPETKEKISKALKGRIITWANKSAASRMSNPNYKPPVGTKGSKHSRAKKYIVRYPDGSMAIEHGLRAFCISKSLDHKTLLDTLKGVQTHHKGFVILARLNDHHESEYTQAGGKGARPVTVQAEDMVCPSW